MADFDFLVSLSVKNLVSPELKKIRSSLHSIKRDFSKGLELKLDKTSHNSLIGLKNKIASPINLPMVGVNRLKNNFNEISDSILPLTAATAALGASLVFPIKKAKEYEDAMLEVKRAVDLNIEDQSKLSEALMTMGGGSFLDLTKIAAGFGKAGVSNVNEIIQMTDILNKASKAVGLNAEFAQTAISKIISLNDLQMIGSNVTKVSDILTNLENTMSNVAATDLSDVWKRSAKHMNQLNLDIEEQAALASVALSRGVSPELAASEFTMFANRLGDLKDKLKIDFRELIKTKGLEGLKETIRTLRDLGPEKMKDLLGSEGQKFILTFSEQGISELNNAFKNAKDAGGSVLKEWTLYTKTFTYSWEMLTKSINNFLATIGGPLKEAIAPNLLFFSNIINNITILLNRFPVLNQVIIYTIATFFKWSLLLTTIGIATRMFSKRNILLRLSFLGLNSVFILLRNSSIILSRGFSLLLFSTHRSIMGVGILIKGFFLLSNSILITSKNLLIFSSNTIKNIVLGSLSLLSSSIYSLLRSFVLLGYSILFSFKKLLLLTSGFILSSFNRLRVSIVSLNLSFVNLRKVLGLFSIGTLLAIINPMFILGGVFILLAGSIAYLIYNWESFSESFRTGYNNYIAPVVDSLKKAFYNISFYILDLIKTIQKSFLYLKTGISYIPGASTLLGINDKDREDYKKNIEEIENERKRLLENNAKDLNQIKSTYSKDEWKDSLFNQLMEGSNSLLMSGMKKIKEYSNSIMGLTSEEENLAKGINENYKNLGKETLQSKEKINEEISKDPILNSIVDPKKDKLDINLKIESDKTIISKVVSLKRRSELTGVVNIIELR